MSDDKRRRYAAEIQAQVTALEDLLPEVNARLDLTDTEWVHSFMRDSSRLFEKILSVKATDEPHVSHFILAELRETCARLNQPWSFMADLNNKRAEVRNLTAQISNDPDGTNPGDLIAHQMG